METHVVSLLFLLLGYTLQNSKSVELTFELLDNAKDCFYEHIEKNTSAVLEFQVVTGGSYDVDVSLIGPNKGIIYQKFKEQYDSHEFVAKETGEYAVCFSNEFSTFSHKLVFMDFHVGGEEPLPGISEQATVLTQMETSAQVVHLLLNNVSEHQVHYKLMEAQGRKRAEDLNSVVFWWSATETLAIMTVGVIQVYILKNFFSEKRPNQYTRH